MGCRSRAVNSNLISCDRSMQPTRRGARLMFGGWTRARSDILDRRDVANEAMQRGSLLEGR
jgi:hypothetical protein